MSSNDPNFDPLQPSRDTGSQLTDGQLTWNPYAPPLEESAAVGEKPVVKPHPHIGWGLLWTLGLMISQLGVAFVVVAVLMAVVFAQDGTLQGFPAAMQESAVLMMATGPLSTLLVGVAAAAIVYRREITRKLAFRSCTILQWVLVVLLVVPLGVLSSEVANWATEALQAMGLGILINLGAEEIQLLGQQNFVLVLIVACVLPALGEEIFFRGFLSRGFVAWHGVIAGSLMASFLFGFVHLIPVQACAACVMGVALQYIFLTTRSLWAPIVLHLLNNAMAFLFMRYGNQFPVPGFTITADDGSVTHTPVILVLSAAVAVAVMLWLLYQTRTTWRLPGGKAWSPGFFATEAPPKATNAAPANEAPRLAALGLLLVTYPLFVWTLWASQQIL